MQKNLEDKIPVNKKLGKKSLRKKPNGQNPSGQNPRGQNHGGKNLNEKIPGCGGIKFPVDKILEEKSQLKNAILDTKSKGTKFQRKNVQWIKS